MVGSVRCVARSYRTLIVRFRDGLGVCNLDQDKKTKQIVWNTE